MKIRCCARLNLSLFKDSYPPAEAEPTRSEDGKGISMLVNGHLIEKQESDPFIGWDFRVLVECEVRRNPPMRTLLHYINDAILLSELTGRVEYWAGSELICPPYGRILVVNQAPSLTDAILFELERQSLGTSVRIHALFTIEHTEPSWTLRQACTNPTEVPLFRFDLDQTRDLGGPELRMMGSILGVADLDRHARTLRLVHQVIQREVAANAAGAIVARDAELPARAQLH